MGELCSVEGRYSEIGPIGELIRSGVWKGEGELK